MIARSPCPNSPSPYVAALGFAASGFLPNVYESLYLVAELERHLHQLSDSKEQLRLHLKQHLAGVPRQLYLSTC